MKKSLLLFIFLLCSASVLLAQEAAAVAAPPQEEDVLYFKNGSVWRGHVISRTAKVGKIQMRDGSINVYNPKQIKLSMKEPVSNNAGAQKDSIRTVGIVKQVVEEENRKQQAEEDWNNLQKMIDEQAQKKSAAEAEKDVSTWKLYSVIGLVAGIGMGDLPVKAEGDAVMPNEQSFFGGYYGLGGRYGVFGIGLNVGIRQVNHSLGALLTSADTTPGFLHTPTSVMYIPVGMDIRLDFAPRSTTSLVMILHGSYALKVNAAHNDTFKSYMLFSPALGLRFGQKVSSLLGAGYEMQMVDGDMIHFATLRFGINF